MGIRSQIKNRIGLIRSPEDRTILLVCMAISLFFWILVKLSKTYSAVKPVDVVTLVSPEMALLNQPPEDVKVEVEGTGWSLVSDLFSDNSAKLEVNLTNGNSRTLESAQLKSAIKEEIGGGREVQVVNINYNQLRFELEPRLRKKVPVRLPMRLELASDHQLESEVTMEPDSVGISGPASKVAKIEEWILDSLVITQLGTSAKRSLPVKSEDKSLRVSPPVINLNIPVEATTQKSFFVNLNVANSPEDSLSIYPRQVRVSCTVGLSRFEEVTPDSFKLVLDLAEVPVSENKRTAPIQLVKQPDFVHHTSFSPKSAEFFIVKSGEEKVNE